MDDVKAYMSEQPLRVGKLAAWEAELTALRNAGASFRYICRYLATKGVAAHPGEVQRFLKRQRRRQPVQSGGSSLPKRPEPQAAQLPTFEWPPKKKDESPW